MSNTPETGYICETVIARHDDPGDNFVLGIVIKHENRDGFDVLQAARDAAAEFCGTTRGEAEIAANSGAFNWGDFVNSVPDSICKKHGFTVFDTFVTELIVDHDESLIPEG